MTDPKTKKMTKQGSELLSFGSWHLVMTFLGLTMLIPFVWMVLTSLKPLAELGNDSWLPSDAQWQNYKEVFSVIPFGRFYWNSLFIASWVTFLQVLTSSLAAFSFFQVTMARAGQGILFVSIHYDAAGIGYADSKLPDHG